MCCHLAIGSCFKFQMKGSKPTRLKILIHLPSYRVSKINLPLCDVCIRSKVVPSTDSEVHLSNWIWTKNGSTNIFSPEFLVTYHNNNSRIGKLSCKLYFAEID